MISEYDNISGRKQTLTPHDKIILTEVRPLITKIDIDNGSVIRYFVCRTTDDREVIEVSKNVYGQLKNNPLYKVVELDWVISNSLTPAKQANEKSIALASKTIPNIKHKLRNLEEYLQT